MRLVPTGSHALTDYLAGALLIAVPFLLDWMRGLTVPLVIAGAALIAYSSLTDYELGIRPLIGMRLHLWLDGAVGANLLCLPVIFRIDAFSPLLMIAGIMLVLPLTTELEPSAVPIARRGRAHARPRRSHSE
jgi:hypothetical protein